jgi:hypothetical protein
MRRDIDRFPPESTCGLSYQANSRPRIVRPPDMTVFAGTGSSLSFFDPAETT